MRAFIELEYGLARFEVAAIQQARLFKLREHSVNCSQANIEFFGKECAIHIFGAQMPDGATLKNLENFQPWQRRFEANAF